MRPTSKALSENSHVHLAQPWHLPEAQPASQWCQFPNLQQCLGSVDSCLPHSRPFLGVGNVAVNETASSLRPLEVTLHQGGESSVLVQMCGTGGSGQCVCGQGGSLRGRPGVQVPGHLVM